MTRRSHSARPRLASALAVLACLAAGALATPIGAAGSERLSPAATAAPGEAARVADYWTPARMRGAQPLDSALGGDPLAHASFGPVATPVVPPFTVNGRLFVRQGRKRGFCSATAINSASRRLVLTAAHCLNSGPRSRFGNDVWSRYVEFVPAFTSGIGPFGAFVARRNAVFAPRQWVQFGNPNFDVGAMLTSPNAEGINVADAVGGGATIATDLSRRQQFKTFGYPGKSSSLQECESPYVGDDPLTYRIPGPPTIAIRCHWAPGASGGGWLTENGTMINGVTSYGKRRDRVHTFSPYFSQSTVGRLVAGM
ncbi:MAG TPA: hypothetical protein VNP96_13200 [Solirubrobacterales bacterium]|nr:hypothetical protein [Solirubrobacterales bacterium]